MKVYVVYWVDLDDDYLKKSEVSVLGVYANKLKAEKIAEDYYHKGYAGDSRCYYTNVDELELNKTSIDALEYLRERYGDDYAKEEESNNRVCLQCHKLKKHRQMHTDFQICLACSAKFDKEKSENLCKLREELSAELEVVRNKFEMEMHKENSLENHVQKLSINVKDL